jgi:hypothetical protein
MGRVYSTNGEKIGRHVSSYGKAIKKTPLGRPRSKWVYNIWIDLRRTGRGGVVWNGLGQNRGKGH